MCGLTEDGGDAERTRTVNLERAGQADETTDGGSPSASVADVFVQRLGQLKRVVAGMGFAAADAEDILQDVFVSASKTRGEFRGPDEAAAWLIRVAVNRCVLEFRRRQRFRKATAGMQRRLCEEAPPASERPNDVAIASEELETMRRAMQGLDESLLCPLVLRYFCGMVSAQVGEVLQLPASTVRGRLREARMILARRLMKRRGEDGCERRE